MSTPQSLESVNVTLHGQKDFTDVIKLSILRLGVGIILDYLDGSSVITVAFVRGMQETQDSRVMGGRGSQATEHRRPLEGRETDSPQSIEKE